MKIEIEIYFDNTLQIEPIIRDIKNLIQSGRFDYESGGFSYKTIITKEPPFEEKVIGDVSYMILPSKMNKQ